DDHPSLRRAIGGVDGVFVLAPMDPALDRMEGNVLAAAVEVGVGHFVKMSTTKPEPDSPIPWWRAHWRSEQALQFSGLSWTMLRPNGISFFLLGPAASVRDLGAFDTVAAVRRLAVGLA